MGSVAAIIAIINAAPKAIELARAGKEFIDQMYAAKLISAEVQNATKAYCDAVMAAQLAGIKPPHWQVQPDEP